MAKTKAHTTFPTFDARTVVGVIVAVVGWTLSLAALYYGLSGQIMALSTAATAQTSNIQGLQLRLETAEAASRAQERALIELTVTLRTKEILK